MATFKVGTKFDSANDLANKITDYEKKNYVKLWIRDSRSIESAIKRKSISKDKVSTDKVTSLNYYTIYYNCIHGGRKHKSAGSGARQSSTFRDGCPFKLSIRLSDDGNSLVVSDIKEEHNHPTSKAAHQYYPKERKLDDDQRTFAEQMIKLGANKKKLQHQLQSDTDKKSHAERLKQYLHVIEKKGTCKWRKK